MMKAVFARFLLLSFVPLVLFSACLKSTYPENYVTESVLKILRSEYNIPLAQVEITGKTIHLYLPVERLFTADLDDIKTTYINIFGLPIKNVVVVWTAKLLSAPQDGYWEMLSRLYRAPFLRWLKMNWIQHKVEKKKIEKIQDAIELHPEVQDEIGQMLFAVARVARSTDRKLDFYSAQITDVRSGHEFILQGYLPDMNRLQLLDISQAEYHKRILRDTHVNNRAQVHYPVRSFFLDLNQKTREEINQKYFSKLTSEDWLERFYFKNKAGSLFPVSQMTWEILDVRSFLSPAGGRALVYVEIAKLPRDPHLSKLTQAKEKFLFEILIKGKGVQILRIIPFNLLNEMLSTMPEFQMNEKTLEENIKTWSSEFLPKEVFLEEFLSRQMMMRLYDKIYQDERIANTFTDLHFEVRFRDKPRREFVFEAQPSLKDSQVVVNGKSLLAHEDMIYLENMFVTQAATTFHSYEFKNFDALAMELPAEGERMVATPADLELFYRKKKKLSDVLRADGSTIPLSDQMAPVR